MGRKGEDTCVRAINPVILTLESPCLEQGENKFLLSKRRHFGVYEGNHDKPKWGRGLSKQVFKNLCYI